MSVYRGKYNHSGNNPLSDKEINKLDITSSDDPNPGPKQDYAGGRSARAPQFHDSAGGMAARTRARIGNNTMADEFTTALTRQQIIDLLNGAGCSLTTSAVEKLKGALDSGSALTPEDAGLLAVPQDS